MLNHLKNLFEYLHHKKYFLKNFLLIFQFYYELDLQVHYWTAEAR